MELAVALGRAGATVLARRSGHAPRLLVARDPRRSGPLLESALAAGAMSVGADVWRLGVATTPCVAYLVRVLDVDAGVVISASHNPAAYNGIKFFSHDGFKLPDALEDEIAALVEEGALTGGGAAVGGSTDRGGEMVRYVDMVAALAGDLSGLRLVMDCANGAAYGLGPAALRQAGARVEAIAASPDGFNINEGCGSLHTEALAREVVARGADLGLAFDGDADRLVAVDEQGQTVDGDGLMAVIGCDLLARGDLPGNTVVGTVMSNFGLELCLRARGGRLLRTRVGDRYVLEEMRRGGYNLGGEQSGHVILLRHHTTGDGLCTGAVLCGLLRRDGRRLSELAAIVPRIPQVLRNVRVRDARALEGNGAVASAVAAAEAAMGARGRVVVRPSGTEPLVRVMVEGEDAALVDEAVEAISRVVEAEMGAAG